MRFLCRRRQYYWILANHPLHVPGWTLSCSERRLLVFCSCIPILEISWLVISNQLKKEVVSQKLLVWQLPAVENLRIWVGVCKRFNHCCLSIFTSIYSQNQKWYSVNAILKATAARPFLLQISALLQDSLQFIDHFSIKSINHGNVIILSFQFFTSFFFIQFQLDFTYRVGRA